MTFAKAIASLAAVLLLAGVAWSQPGKDKKDGKEGKPEAKGPATHKVEKKLFKIERTLKGTLTPVETAELGYRPNPSVQAGQGPLIVRKVAEHGTKVSGGDIVLAIDTTRMRDAINQMIEEQKSLAANIKLAEEELPSAEKSAPLELDAAANAKRLADDELKYFLDVAKPFAIKSSDFELKFSKFRVESAEDELKQLERMYKSNDLTEDTEKIILKRTRMYLDYAKFDHEQTLLERDRFFKHILPNREKSLRDSAARLDIANDKAKKTIGPALDQKRVTLAKMRGDFTRNNDRLDAMKKDHGALTMRAPFNGTVYFGRFQGGQWSINESLQNKLVPGGIASPEEVLMTIVKPGQPMMPVQIDEADVYAFKGGMSGTVKLPSQPERKLTAKVVKLSPVPSGPGKFAATIALEPGAADLSPGLAAAVKFTLYARKDAIAIPSKLIHEDDDKQVVYLLVGGKEERREVTVGRVEGENSEILAGLNDGDQVLLERLGKTSTKGGGE